MKKPKKEMHGLQGMTFGAMDAIINVIGIVIGLGVIGNKVAVVIGLLVAGIANSLGNSAGFHVSEETEGIHTRKEVWQSTLMAFVGTFATTFILLIPLLLFELSTAILICAGLGVVCIILLATIIGNISGFTKRQTCKLMCEYVALAALVIVIAYFVGNVASSFLEI